MHRRQRPSLVLIAEASKALINSAVPAAQGGAINCPHPFLFLYLKLITYMETPYGGLWYAAGKPRARADSGLGQLIVPPLRWLFTCW